MEWTPTPRAGWGVEYLFAALLGFFGMIFAFAVPPIQTPDEPSHFHRAYQVSEGVLFTHPVGEWGGGEIPTSVLNVSERFNFLVFHRELHTTAEPFEVLWSMPLNPAERRPVPFPGSAYYSFVPYVPQAIGIALARAAGCGPLGLMYAGRVANLALAVMLVFLAVRAIPVFKLVLGTIALLPIAVQQVASLNPDGSAIPVAFLFSAYVLRWAIASESAMRKRDVALLLSLAAWLTLCKFPYSLLALLYLGVPVARLGTRRRWAAVGAALFLTAFGLAAALTQLKDNTPDRLVPANRGASISQQTEFIRTHPFCYARILAWTAAEHARIYLEQCSMLGWLDTPVNPMAMHCYWVFMVVVALGDRGWPRAPSGRLVGAGLAAAVLCMAVIVTSCYVVGCPIRHPIVNGPQGRYFLPVALCFLLPLYQRVLQVQVERRMLCALTGGACTAVLIVSVATIVCRYYFPPERQPLFTLPSLAAAGTQFAAVAFWAWRRYVAADAMAPNELVVIHGRVPVETSRMGILTQGAWTPRQDATP